MVPMYLAISLGVIVLCLCVGLMIASSEHSKKEEREFTKIQHVRKRFSWASIFCGGLVGLMVFAVQLAVYYNFVAQKTTTDLFEFLTWINPLTQYVPYILEQNQWILFGSAVYGVFGMFLGGILGLIGASAHAKPSFGVKFFGLSLLVIPFLNILVLGFAYLQPLTGVEFSSRMLPNIFVSYYNLIAYFMQIQPIALNNPTAYASVYIMESGLFIFLSVGILVLSRKAAFILVMFSATCIIYHIFGLLGLLQSKDPVVLLKSIAILCYFTFQLLFFTNPGVKERFLTQKYAPVQKRPKYISNSTQQPRMV